MTTRARDNNVYAGDGDPTQQKAEFSAAVTDVDDNNFSTARQMSPRRVYDELSSVACAPTTIMALDAERRCSSCGCGASGSSPPSKVRACDNGGDGDDKVFAAEQRRHYLRTVFFDKSEESNKWEKQQVGELFGRDYANKLNHINNYMTTASTTTAGGGLRCENSQQHNTQQYVSLRRQQQQQVHWIDNNSERHKENSDRFGEQKYQQKSSEEQQTEPFESYSTMQQHREQQQQSIQQCCQHQQKDHKLSSPGLFCELQQRQQPQLKQQHNVKYYEQQAWQEQQPQQFRSNEAPRSDSLLDRSVLPVIHAARSGGDDRSISAQPVSDSVLLALRRSQPNTRLFRALFQYIPLRDSPNENPHLELALQAGDFVLVHGHMDEDRFYFGETLTGRAGLVPSNYVERVPDYMLLQNSARMPNAQVSGGSAAADANSTLVAAKKSVATQSPPVRGTAASLSACRLADDNDAASSATPGVGVSSLCIGGLINSDVSASTYGSGVTVDGYRERHGAGSPSFVLNVPMHLAQISHDFTDSSPLPASRHKFADAASDVIGRSGSRAASTTLLPDSVCPYPFVDVSQVLVQEVKCSDQPRVPFPRELCVEKRLSRSVLISWLSPDDLTGTGSGSSSSGGSGVIQPTATEIQYHVCVDGQVRSVVPGRSKCKALVEDLDLERSVNISVRAIFENGTHSADATCTIAVGADAPVAPQHVRVTQITPVSARVSWYPSNSNAEHVLLLNAAKIGVCPGGAAIYQVQLSGLQPSTIYRVSVRTKQPRAVLEKRPIERCVDFKTLPKRLPDPPENVQVEAGPQPGTLLISWTPVLTQPRPPSRAAVHSYLVYADGRNIAQIPSPNADHFVLRLADFADDPPIFITVRTRTREDVVSADSNVVRVPRSISDNEAVASTSALLNALNSVAQASTSAGGSGASRFGGGAFSGGSASLTNSLIGALPTSESNQQQSAQQMHSLHHSLPLELIQQQQQQPTSTGLLTTINATGPLAYSGISVGAQQQQQQQQQQLASAMSLLNLGAYGVTPQQQQQAAAAAAAAAAVLASQQQQQQQQLFQQKQYGTSQVPHQIVRSLSQAPQLATSIGNANTSQHAGIYNNSGNGMLNTTLSNYNNSSNQMLNDVGVCNHNHSNWKHQSQTGQYYIFHPKSLYKEFPTTEEIKPSVLELENNYFIKHQQQQAANRVLSAADYDAASRSVPSLVARGTGSSSSSNYYASFQPHHIGQRSGSLSARYLPSTRQWPTTGGGANIMPGNAFAVGATRRPSIGGDVAGTSTMTAPLPLRLSRVRSEEQLLDTRSEPDLRPIAAAHYSTMGTGGPIVAATSSAGVADYYNSAADPADGMTPHYFVALYDYDHSMSPNPNAQQEELSFRKHQLIKVYGDVDRDGFYYGEVGRRFGLVPSNMVIEIAKEDLQLPERRRSEIYPPMDPVIRRMRWGSLKSRSYDNPGERSDRHTVPRYYAQRNAAASTASRAEMPMEPYQRQYQGSPAYSSSLERKERAMPSQPSSARYYHESVGATVPPSSAKYYSQTRGGPPCRNDAYLPYGTVREDAYAGAPTAAPNIREQYSTNQRQSFERMDSYDSRDGRGGKRSMAGYYTGKSGGTAPQKNLAQLDYDQYSEHREAPLPRADTRQRAEMANGNGSDVEYGGGGASSSRYEYDDGDRSATGALAQRTRQRANESMDERDVNYNGQFAQKQQQYRQDSQPNLIRHHPLNPNDPMANVMTRRIPAKYNYNSKELSPNPDAEVELSFNRGDLITVFGEVDEDGFFMGELNGVRGLVPSNFLDLASAQPPVSRTSSTSQLAAQPQQQQQQRPKGVAFSGEAAPTKRRVAAGAMSVGSAAAPLPTRQSSQTMIGGPKLPGSGIPPGFALTSSSASSAAGGKAVKMMSGGSTSGGGAAAKSLTKKSSDLTNKSLMANNTAALLKKSVQSTKKDPSGKIRLND